jgi:hypothetical protein
MSLILNTWIAANLTTNFSTMRLETAAPYASYNLDNTTLIYEQRKALFPQQPKYEPAMKEQRRMERAELMKYQRMQTTRENPQFRQNTPHPRRE